jgi:hypothetical protein
MSYPTEIPTFRAAVMAYDPPTDIAEAFYVAQGQGSTVVQAVGVFDLLGPVAELDQDGLALLLGAAHLIASNGWHGLAGEAATILATRVGQLVPVVNNEPAQP